jgi:hypothetical protein
MKTPSEWVADPRVGAVKRFVSRYMPFLATVLAIFLIAVLLPGRSPDDTTDTAGELVTGPDEDAPAEDLTPGETAAKRGPVATKAAAPQVQGNVLSFEEAKKKGVALVPNCDQATGRIMIPSRFAPPCTQKFVAPNAGASWQGVTDKEIKIAYYQGAGDAASDAVLTAAGANDTDEQERKQVLDWSKFYESHYNLWGRKVKWEFVTPSGEATDDAAGISDAKKVDLEIKAFASVGAPNNSYVNELVARKVMCFCTVSLPIESYIKWAPYVWTTLLASTQGYIHRAEYVNRLKNGKAKWAYDGINPTQGFKDQKRVFGFLYYETEDFAYKKGAEFFVKHLKDRYGIDIPPSRVSAYNGYPDVAATQEQARPIIQKMKNAGVNSLIFSGDPFGPIFFTQEATRQLYGPEWIITGSALTDTSFFARLYDQDQWSHAFGISYLAARLPEEKSESLRLYKWQFNDDEPSAPNSYGLIRLPISIMFNGFHLAGPTLTPETFRKGMNSQPILGKGGITTIASSYGNKGLWPWPEDPVAADDVTEIWWDRNANGEDERGVVGDGLYRYVNMGKRLLPGEHPTGEPKAFSTANTETIYENPPPVDKWPCYPSPATKKKDLC